MAVATSRGGVARWFGLSGLFLAVAGLTVYALWPREALAVSVIEGAALLCLFLAVVTNFRAVRAASTGRAARSSLHSGLLLVIFVAVVALVNFLAARHSIRWDLSESGRFSLAPQTIQVLETLPLDVKLTLFVQDAGQDQGQTKRALKSLVEGYQHHAPRLTAEYVDPDNQPAVAKRYGITQYNTVVFESGGQETRVRFSTPAELDNREQLFTNALIRIMRTEQKQIVFLDGHGEHGLEDAGGGGFSAVKEALEREGYQVSSAAPARDGAIPANATVVVVGGPAKLMVPEEVDLLRAYLRGGGRVAVLVDALAESGLGPLLAEWGVILDENLVIEPSTIFGAGPETVVAAGYSTTHPMTKGFNLATVFPVARSLRADPGKQGAFRYEAVVLTSDKSWGETNLTDLQQVRLDRLEDLNGPLHLAAAVEPVLPAGDEKPAPNAPAPAARLAVFGDSDFPTNGYFRLLGNGDLFLNAINWLAADEQTIAIRPKEARLSPLVLTEEQEQTLLLVSTMLLPGMALLVGVGAWQWRRRL